MFRNTVVRDNGSQFVSAEFSVVKENAQFQACHIVTEIPTVNRQSQNAVKTAKRLLYICKQSVQSEFQAQLDWRNRPTKGMQTSLAQQLMGKCKTLLPVLGQLLQPRYSNEQDTQDLLGWKEKQAYYYNRHVKPLGPIAPRETVCLQLPGQQAWSAGRCLDTCGHRSCKAEVVKVVYRRNCGQLVRTVEPEPQVIEPEIDSRLLELSQPTQSAGKF